MIIVGDSLLRGMQDSTCWPDLIHRKVCCLRGTWVRDISRKHPSLIHPCDYPLLIVQASNDEAAERSMRIIKKGFSGLGWLVDGEGVQVAFSSFPSVVWRDSEEQENPSHKYMAERLVQTQEFWVL